MSPEFRIIFRHHSIIGESFFAIMAVIVSYHDSYISFLRFKILHIRNYDSGPDPVAVRNYDFRLLWFLYDDRCDRT